MLKFVFLKKISVKISTNHTAKPAQDKNSHKDNEDEWELVPPDGGWGWLILAGSMLVNLLVPGTIKSFGVLFVEFIEAFDASPATAAWIPALCYFLYSSLGKRITLVMINIIKNVNSKVIFRRSTF